MKKCLNCNLEFFLLGWSCPNCNWEPETIEGYLSFAPELALENNYYPEESFKKLAQLEGSNFWFKSRNRLIAWAVQKYSSTAKNFLEIGCGTGFVLQNIEKKFPQFQLFGSEIHWSGLSYAFRRLEKTKFIQMDAKKIPFSNEFDAIGMFDVLEHIDEDERVLSELYNALSPDGHVFITVPQHPFMWSQADDYACHVRRYTIKDLENKLNRVGFKLVKKTSFVSFLFPLMLVSRLLLKYKKKKFDINTELDVNPYVNYLFEKIQNFELFFIRLGVVFRFGGSLLVIAKKPTAESIHATSS